MEKDTLGYFRGLLNSRKNALIDGATETVVEMTDEDDSFPDPNDRATLESDRNFVLRIRDRERKLISKIEKALERIEVGRSMLEELILEKAAKLAPQYGIELIDARIKRINYVEDVRKKVYDRMIAERKRAAEKYRSEGLGKSAEIQGQLGKELKVITSQG